jgi:hypothetical protein
MVLMGHIYPGGNERMVTVSVGHGHPWQRRSSSLPGAETNSTLGTERWAATQPRIE